MATDKLDMPAIYSKWPFINRNRLLVILKRVNSQSENKTLLQLTLDLLSFRHDIEISHLAILQIPGNILSKQGTISVFTNTFQTLPEIRSGAVINFTRPNKILQDIKKPEQVE